MKRLLFLILLAGCGGGSVVREPLEGPPLRFAGAERIVAIGDVHGDVHALRGVLRLAGLIDDADAWVGGDAVLVQTGDLLDRGDDEAEIFDLMDVLAKRAEAAGGAVVRINGNHEIMNARGDFRYVTPGALEDFGPDRSAAFEPGSGAQAIRLARFGVVAVVGDSVFVHGGLNPEHVPTLDALNAATSRWLSEGGDVPVGLRGESSPIWTRRYGRTPTEGDCDALGETLGALEVSRLVVGHTVQDEGITNACDARVWRIDVGMAKHYGGAPQALEITSEGVKVLGASD